jgi:hypothetical protein
VVLADPMVVKARVASARQEMLRRRWRLMAVVIGGTVVTVLRW